MANVLENRGQISRPHSPPMRSWEEDFLDESLLSRIENPFRLQGGNIYYTGQMVFGTHRHSDDAGTHTETVAWDAGDHLIGLLHGPSYRGDTTSSAENLRHRLANANDLFRRKASEVFNDKDALNLLDTMYRDVVVDISSFDACKDGISLAKLTAANFCEVGAKVIYITEAGQRFVDSLASHGRI